MTTHDYPTRKVRGFELDETMVLVGESGGLSAVYDNSPSSAMPGLMMIDTEHGPLYLDPDEEYDVYDDHQLEGVNNADGSAIDGGTSSEFIFIETRTVAVTAADHAEAREILDEGVGDECIIERRVVLSGTN
jgi:hypothetical protein